MTLGLVWLGLKYMHKIAMQSKANLFTKQYTVVRAIYLHHTAKLLTLARWPLTLPLTLPLCVFRASINCSLKIFHPTVALISSAS
jgi:hypothetical protein